MKSSITAFVFGLTAIIFLVAVTSGFSTEYVVLIHSGVNLRIGPTSSSIIVAEASKGQLYHFIGEVDDWYKIRMFTGDERFVSKSMAGRLEEAGLLPGHAIALPPSAETLRDMVRRIRLEKERARREAEKIIPSALDEERNMMYRNILEDRYILKVFRNREVHPALYEALMEEGTRKGW